MKTVLQKIASTRECSSATTSVYPSNTLPATPEASYGVFVSLTGRKHRTIAGIKLIYFNLMGRAEVTRFILAQAGVS